MSTETGVRTLIIAADGTVAIHAASAKRQGIASRDAWLTRAEAKALAALSGARVIGRLALDDAPSDRRLRDAWRVDPRTGRVTVDLEAARDLRAERWTAEAAELRMFIQTRLLPKARLLGQPDAIRRLNTALAQVDAVEQDLTARIGAMTVEELASHQPAWPGLGVGRR